MDFRKYQHIERFGTTEVDGIELGKCYVFPKIDFKALNHLTIAKVKQVKPEIFG